MQIDPETFYQEQEDCPALAVLGKRQTRAKHRHEGKGCPYIKVGARVVYKGADILKYLEAQRVVPEAA